ncbi:MAG: N-acetyltransferase [Bacteroidaceae bacterium]|nr:N-acetyltransferase [Bacteroidaceae bacterium]
MNTSVSIVFEAEACRSAAYDNGKFIGQCVFRPEGSAKWVITLTEVTPSYSGKGIARMLVEKVIEEARAHNMKIIPFCSYARNMMKEDEFKDVLFQ